MYATLNTNDEQLKALNNKAVPIRIVRLPWQELGLSYTATGYGSKIPTEYQIFIGKRWYRVYTPNIQ
jgi:hypothetical protein